MWWMDDIGVDLNPQKPCPCIKDVVHEYADLQPKD